LDHRGRWARKATRAITVTTACQAGPVSRVTVGRPAKTESPAWRDRPVHLLAARVRTGRPGRQDRAAFQGRQDPPAQTAWMDCRVSKARRARWADPACQGCPGRKGRPVRRVKRAIPDCPASLDRQVSEETAAMQAHPACRVRKDRKEKL
jgi:hypothetical protein